MLLLSAVPATNVNLRGSFDTGIKLIAEEAFCSSHSPPTENQTGLIF
jgi:hypothetical protein